MINNLLSIYWKYNGNQKEPFKKDDTVREYHHTSLFDDFQVVYAHFNDALDVIRDGVNYGLFVSRCVPVPTIKQE